MQARFIGWLSIILFVVITLSACGGSGGSSEPPPSNPGSGTPPPVTPPVEPPVSTTTLSLSTPTARPAVIPPASVNSPITFIALTGGTTAPDEIFLDEVDATGQVITSDVARLKDDGAAPDTYLGDRAFMGSVSLGNPNAQARYFRARAEHDGETYLSGITRFWVSGCPVTARPSNPLKTKFDVASGANIFTNEVRIKIDADVSPDLVNLNGLAAAIDGVIVGCIPALNEFLIEFNDDDTVAGVYTAIDSLLALPEIINAFPNAQAFDATQSDDPFECDVTVDTNCQWYLSRIRAEQAWAIAGGGDEQRSVAIIDFGVDCNHEDLDCDNERFNDDPVDHGTGIAGVINAGRNNGVGIAGLAWNTEIYPYSFLSSAGSQYKMSELIAASLEAESSKVINISAGTATDYNEQIKDALCTAIDSGRLIVGAAGNPSGDAAVSCEQQNIFPAQYNSLGQCANGADLQKGLLIVGATDIDNNLAEWAVDGVPHCSNQLYAEIYAPGKDIITLASTGSQHYAAKTGTSLAAPLVAGAASIVWSANPQFSPAEIHDQLIATGANLSASNTEPRTITNDARLEGKPLLDLYRALGGNDDINTPDTSPAAFIFSNQINVNLNTLITSEVVVISGLDSAAPIDINNGYYSIDGAPFTSAAGAIRNGQELRLRVRSANNFNTQTQATIAVGDVTQTFAVTTMQQDTSPGTFQFVDLAGVPLNFIAVSNEQTITGISNDVPISVVDGEYSIDGGTFTAAVGVINNNQTVRVRHTAAATSSTTTTTSLTIGDITRIFNVTTRADDSTPDQFIFTDQTNAAFDAEVISNPITVSGINSPSVISVSGGDYSVDGNAFSSDADVVSNGQTVRVRAMAGSAPDSQVFVTLNIGGVNDTFSVTTQPADNSPDSFDFVDQSDVAPATEITSNAVTITGINLPVQVSVQGGDYSIDGAAFTSTAGVINNNQSIRVRALSPSGLSSVASVSLTIGDRTAVYNVSTAGADIIPDTFTFNDQSNIPLNTLVLSNSISVSGINTPVTVSINNGEYAIDGGAFTANSGQVSAGQSIQVRLNSAAIPATTTSATLSVGATSDTFSVTTLAADVTPASFIFTDQVDVPFSTDVTSDSVVISGINTPAPISVNGGSYSINGGVFTATNGVISNGQSVRVRVTSSANPSTTSNVQLTVGDVSDTFTVTTIAADTTPDNFTFVDQNDVAIDTSTVSNTVTITGINVPVSISVTGGEYAIDGGAFTTAEGTVANNQTVRLRQTSSSNVATTTNTTLTVGSISDTFSVTTIAADTTPDGFIFTDQNNVAPSTLITSNAITVSGINTGTSISVIGGSYSIDGAAYTSADGTVNDGDSVTLQQTSSANLATTTNTVLTIGGVSDTFSVATVGADTTPDTFSFTDQTGVALNSPITSNTITVSGINTDSSISVTGGTYSINGGAFTASGGTVADGQTVRVRVQSSPSPETATNATLTIGGVSDTFSVTTVAADITPDTFSFTDQNEVPLNTVVTSNTITVSGINTAAPISITGGTYSIDGGAFTGAAGTILNGQTVAVRQTSSPNYSTQTTAQLTIGGVADVFAVTSVNLPVPNLSNLSAQIYTVDEPIALISFSNAGGGSLTSCTANTLPTGLTVSISASNDTCEISGTPTSPFTTTSVSITAVNSSGSDSATISLTVNAANVAPVANAGPDQTVNEQSQVNLSGAASTDSDGSIASYSWAQTSGTTVSLSNANAVAPSFTAPVTSANEVLVFNLTVTDNQGLTDTDSVTINITDIPDLAVTTTSPSNSATNVFRGSSISVSFNQTILANSVSGSDFVLQGPSGFVATSINVSGAVITISPSQELEPESSYTATISGSVSGLVGNTLGSDLAWSFTTEGRRWRGAERVESETGITGYTDLQINSDGRAIAVWEKNDGLGFVGIWANEYLPSFGWGVAQQILVPQGQGGAGGPAISSDAHGNAIAVFYQFNGTRTSIRANRYSTGGWGSALAIEANPGGNAGAPYIAVNNNGDAFAIWNQGNILASYYNSTSTNWSPPILVGSNNGSSKPQIAIDNAGNAVAVWNNTVSGHTGIWVNRYSVGAGWGTAVQIDTDVGSAEEPQIGMDENGNAIVVWQQLNAASNYNVWANRYNFGVGWLGAELIETNAEWSWYPRIAMDKNGNAIVAWQVGSSPNPSRYIWARQYGFDTGWGVPVQIETAEGISREPQVALDDSGNAMVVWVHTDNGTNGKARFYNAQSGTWEIARTLERLSGAVGQLKIGMHNDGTAVAIWKQSSDVWSNRFE